MNGQSWDRVKRVFQDALDRPRHERAAYVSEICGNDHALLAEVESLLATHERAGSFADRPAIELLDALAVGSKSGLIASVSGLTGQIVSHYRIVEKLGGGGMGVVYRALDLRLQRSVALKFLPPELTRDEDAKRRFVLEAQAASALDHPNICTIHEIDEAPDGQLFLAMACYVGETLQKKIDRGPLALDEALDYAMQTALGLVTAHAAGIIHRDIKPANVMVTHDGLVKILDFGLAKLLGHTAMTKTGTRLGTIAYMSPEQTRGIQVDARSDLWSLGVVLYELIAGRRPFDGEHQLAIANAIATTTAPPLTSLRTGVPMELERIVNRALSKQPEDRYQTAADLRSELRRLTREAVRQPSATVTATQAVTGRNIPNAAIWAIAAVGFTAAVAFLALPRRPAGSQVPRLATPIQIAASTGQERSPSWSPDGRLLAYVSDESGNPDIWVTQVGGGPAVNRTADHSGDDLLPRWSPDGREIAFWSDREGSGSFVMSALAGGARKIAQGDRVWPAGAAWSPDGSDVAYAVIDAGTQWLERRTLRDGTTRRVALPGRTGNARLDLTWSPDGRFIAYVDALGDILNSQVSRLWIVRLSDGKGTPITDGRMSEWSPTWSPDSRMLYFVSNRGGTMDLWQQRITSEGTPDKMPERLTTGLELLDAVISPDGRHVAYTKGRLVANVWRVPIMRERPATWSDAQQLTFDHAYVEYFDLSRDGQKLIVQSDRGGNPDLWMLPASGGEMHPLTTDPTPDWAPAWSPDGREVAFHAYRSGNREIWIQPIGGAARQLTHGEADSVFPRWSPDGKMIAFNARRGGASHIWVVPAAGGEPRQITSGAPAFHQVPDWSPDGRWLAFTASSNQSGSGGIFRVSATGGAGEPLTKGAGWGPRWWPGGERILFVTAPSGSRFMSAAAESNVWSVSLDGKTERAMTNLAGKNGLLGGALGTDQHYLYFTWYENPASDIWVVDVVPSGR